MIYNDMYSEEISQGLDDSMFQEIDTSLEDAERLNRPSLTFWQDAARRFKKKKTAVAGLIILIIFVFFSFAGPYMTPYAYDKVNIQNANLSFTKDFWFGTDELGRNFWTRVWTGGRVSIIIGVIAASLQAGIGIIIGSLAGFIGGKVDMFIMRVVEFMMAFPYLVWVTLLMMVTGSGMIPMILALTLTGWLTMARLVRGQIMSLRNEDYVIAAQSMGGDTKRIILRHMIPNMMGVIIVNMTFAIPEAIFSEAFLSFIGIGIRSPQTSWGMLVSTGMKQIYAYPLRLLIPCICISLTVLSLQLIGDGLRDAFDPKLRT